MFNSSAGPETITVLEAYELLGVEGHVLLDVRTEEEVREVSIPGALNIPLDGLELHSTDLSAHESIHVICRSGGRSSVASALLYNLGITQVKNVSGGILTWQKAGLPTK